MKTFSLETIAAIGLAAVVFASCRSDEVRRPRHVFLVTVDTLRADHMSLYGYPRATTPWLDAFAARSVVFDRAFAQWPKTGPSFASMFTGQYPQTTGLTHRAALRIPDAYLTLAEMMAGNGYTPIAVVSNGVLNQGLGWNSGFAEYAETWTLSPEVSDVPEEYRRWINARCVNQLALPLLDKHRGDEHLFVWLHYSDPHAPYLLPADVENPFLGDARYVGHERAKVEPATVLGDELQLRYYVASYDANVRFADQYLGEALDHARELGLLDDALVIVAADHGESLGEHDYFFGHGRLPYNDGLHVPLMVSYPGRIAEGRRIADPVELVDIYATLSALVAPERPVPGLEGHSLLPYLRHGGEPPAGSPERTTLAFSQAGGGSPLTHFRVVQDRDWKLIYHPPLVLRNQTRPETWELYHLDDDPGEVRNLADDGADAPELRRLSHELSAWMKGSDWIERPAAEIEAQSEETLKALKALGYLTN